MENIFSNSGLFIWHIKLKTLLSLLSALSPVSSSSVTTPRQFKHITQCDHDDDFGGNILEATWLFKSLKTPFKHLELGSVTPLSSYG